MFAALCCWGVALAVPAYRGWITQTQPDGSTIQVRLHGDEFCHWYTDVNGQVVEQGADGYFRPVSAASHQTRLQVGRINRDIANASRRGPRKAAVALGQKHFLVILVQFSDLSFQQGNDQQAFSNLMNLAGYSENGATGSARDYYYENSDQKFEPIFDVYGPVTLSETQAYYGGNNSKGNDQRPREAVKEACQWLDDNTSIDFSQYDLDSDGEVDLVFMYYAGRGEADGGGANCIWPHQWNLSGLDANFTLDGKKINSYACTNEITMRNGNQVLCGIGTACHEFGHAMGLPDLYDTDYEDNGEAGGLYSYSIMCSGSYNNSGRTPPFLGIEERILLDWQEETAIQEITTSGSYSLSPVSNNVAYKTLTDKDGEYFLYECRSKTGWDAYITEPGLIVYHVDKSSREIELKGSKTSTAYDLWYSWQTHNALNENGSHPCFYVVPAAEQDNLNYTGARFAFPGKAKMYNFTGTSWNGVESDVRLSNINYSGNTVTFFATVPSATLNYNVIANPGNGSYSAGSSFELNLVESAAQPVSSVAWFFDDEPVSGTSVTLTAGTHVVEAHLTLTSGETKILELTLTAQ